MKIINGPKMLNLASSTRSIKLAPLTISDNMIADRQLLATLMTTFKPNEFLIFMDSSLELNTFTSLDLGTKTGLKDQFLCTDIEDGISRMITPYEEAAAKEAEEAKKAQEEQEMMASYKQKYESAQTELAKVKSNAKIALEEVENRNNQITRLHDELDSANSTITELRTALQSAADKIESMKNEFNGVCKKFGLTRQCTEGSDPEWNQDLSVIPKYVGLLNQYQDKVTELSSTKSELDAKLHDYDQLKIEFENYKKSWNEMHDRMTKLEAENKAQDELIVKLHTIIGKASAQFNIYVGNDDEWYIMSTTDKTTSETPTEDTNVSAVIPTEVPDTDPDYTPKELGDDELFEVGADPTTPEVSDVLKEMAEDS